MIYIVDYYRLIEIYARNKLIICFTGIDGCGKTTLAKILVRMMNERGIKGKYVHNTYKSFLLRPFMSIIKILLFRGKTIRKNYSEYVNLTKKIYNIPFLPTLYQYLVLLDYLFITIFKIIILLLFNKAIVCDRYLYDVIVNLAIELNYSNDKIKNILKKSLYLFPEPDFVFLIDLPEEIAYHRKNDIPTMNYIKSRRKIYLKIQEELKMTVLDGTKKLEELQREIEREVFGR